MPSPSGPRCVRAVSMRRMPSLRMPGCSMRPAMPHMRSALPTAGGSGCARAPPGGHRRPPLAQHALEDLLVALGASVDEELLDGGAIVGADRRAPLRRGRELAEG